MYRFYCPGVNFSSTSVCLSNPDEVHHLRKVLRLKEGDKIYLFDGKGNEAEGIISSVGMRKVIVNIISVKQYIRNSPDIILACAVPKRGKFEVIVEKATELGVTEIIPLETERTEIIFNKDKLLHKLERFKTIAINASKQSGRSIIPIIHTPMEFSVALDLLTKSGVAIIPSLIGERKNLLYILKNLQIPSKISFFIGPEGDFTEAEYEMAKEKGCVPVSLGNTILRVETAAITVVACAHLFFSVDSTKGPLLL